eukprot:SAG22_NODE_9698_length_574_cov_1.412632_1_plen_163_part_10
MLPPLLLDVQAGQRVLDLCAAPGSKTAQLLTMLAGARGERSLLVANDADTKRCYMLVHQLRRFVGDAVVVTNHKAQEFPAIPIVAVAASESGGGDAKPAVFLFDRVLCDVPCSGDGTIRKSPQLWRQWHCGMGLGMHTLQLAILCRGIELLAVGGKLVYSTCS